MTEPAPVAQHDADAALALAIFLLDPLRFGGLVLRGDSPVRESMVDHAAGALSQRGPVLRVPRTVDEERLLGGIDLSASLAAGQPIRQPGLLERCAGGVVILPMADRVREDVAAPIAQAIDAGSLAVIMLDDALTGDDAGADTPPAILMERAAFHCEVGALRAFVPDERAPTVPLAAIPALNEAQRRALAGTAAILGIDSLRPLLFAEAAALGHAALRGGAVPDDADLAAAVRLVLAPRATRLPQADTAEPPEKAPPPLPPSGDDPAPSEDSPQPDTADLEDMLLEAAAAAIPAHLLDQFADHVQRGGKGQSGRSGQRQKSARRGRPLGSQAGVPGQGRRLALIDSLRAAAPWQTIRRRQAAADDERLVHVRKGDLRVRRYEQRAESLTIFAVDASGSSAISRLAEAKGAIELMLAQAYVKRSQVALIAFRQAGADILLPPTRSLTRARRALAALPGGGGTPLAAGLMAAQQLADAAQRRGQSPTLAILTDGKANVALDGRADRVAAMQEAQQAAEALARAGVHGIVIDISPRPRDEAAALAKDMRARYLPLPYAGSAAMVAAIESSGGPGR